MATPSLDHDKHRLIHRLKAQGLSHRDIAKEAGVGVGTVSKFAKTPLPENLAQERFEELRHGFLKWIGWDGKADVCTSQITNGPKIVANDLHSPEFDEEAIGYMVKSESNQAEGLILAGDIDNHFHFSRYEKASSHYSPVEAFQRTMALLLTLSQAFPWVKIIAGNHDDRFIKYLMRIGVPPEILAYFNCLAPGFNHPLQRMVANMPNVEVVAPLKHDYAEFCFLHQEGDLILVHAEKFSRTPNKAVGDVIHWLKSYAEPMGIVKPFRVVGQAHTHQAGQTFNDYCVVGFELGCMTKTPDYAASPKLQGAQRPSVIGYSKFYQHDGVTDITRSRFVPLRWGTQKFFGVTP